MDIHYFLLLTILSILDYMNCQPLVRLKEVIESRTPCEANFNVVMNCTIAEGYDSSVSVYILTPAGGEVLRGNQDGCLLLGPPEEYSVSFCDEIRGEFHLKLINASSSKTGSWLCEHDGQFDSEFIDTFTPHDLSIHQTTQTLAASVCGTELTEMAWYLEESDELTTTVRSQSNLSCATNGFFQYLELDIEAYRASLPCDYADESRLLATAKSPSFSTDVCINEEELSNSTKFYFAAERCIDKEQCPGCIAGATVAVAVVTAGGIGGILYYTKCYKTGKKPSSHGDETGPGNTPSPDYNGSEMDNEAPGDDSDKAIHV